MGGLQGVLADLSATDLGAVAIEAAVKRAGLANDAVDSVIMGCCLPAGLGHVPARQAALKAGLSVQTPCTTVNKACGSAMRAIMIGHDEILAGSAEVVVAGGFESMSNAPFILPDGRRGRKLGHGVTLDHMFYDALEDAFERKDGQKADMMGHIAEEWAGKAQLTRQMQDDYALRSLLAARTASEDGTFSWEITPVSRMVRQRSVVTERDESPFTSDPGKIPTLKPAFRADGTVTPANSSSISDGAAAVVLMNAGVAERKGANCLARLVGKVTVSGAPRDFPEAPAHAIDKLLALVGWTVGQVDLFEVNEAFAVVPMIAMQKCGIPLEKMNVHGGACALGHPVGASGARIVATLIAALRKHGGRRGVASICLAGGEATALAIELL